jgi:hypothetical protein
MTLLGATAICCLLPRREGIPHDAISTQKVNENRSAESNGKKRGVKGMLPLGGLPLWGSVGVTLIISGLKEQNTVI